MIFFRDFFTCEFFKKVKKDKNWHDKSRPLIDDKLQLFNYYFMLFLLPKSWYFFLGFDMKFGWLDQVTGKQHFHTEKIKTHFTNAKIFRHKPILITKCSETYFLLPLMTEINCKNHSGFCQICSKSVNFRETGSTAKPHSPRDVGDCAIEDVNMLSGGTESIILK